MGETMDNELNQLISEFKEAKIYDNTPKSIEIANKILKSNPDLIKYKEELAKLYFFNQEYDKCIELYKEFIKDYKETDWSNYFIAFSYLYNDDIDKAFDYLDRVKDEENHLKFMRMAYQELEDYEKAIEYGDKLLEINPEDQSTLTAMTNAYSAIGDEDRSSFYFDELCNLEPHLSSFKLHMLYEKEMFYQFIECFEELNSKKMLEFDLKDAYFNFMVGISYLYANMPEESISYLLKSEELSPDPENIPLIAKNYMELNDYINAYRFLKKGLKYDEADEDVLFLLSEVCLMLNENYKSIDYANRLLNLTENYDRIFFVLALDYFDWDDKKTGLTCFKMGAEGTEIDDDYFLEILDRLSKNHQSDRVLKHFKILEEEFPAYPQTYLYRARHHKRMGDYDLAYRDVDKFNSLVEGENLDFDEL